MSKKQLKIRSSLDYGIFCNNNEYWKDRWDVYIYKVAEVLHSIEAEKFNHILEIGPAGFPIVRGSDTLDISQKFKDKTTYFQSATTTPYPVGDKHYDITISTQVWEHLGDQQQKAFKEVMRVSKRAVLSFPYMWDLGHRGYEGENNVHHMVSGETIDKWTLNIKPAIEHILLNKHNKMKTMIRYYEF